MRADIESAPTITTQHFVGVNARIDPRADASIRPYGHNKLVVLFVGGGILDAPRSNNVRPYTKANSRRG